MIVTFRTSAHANITYFGDVALELLRIMGRDDKIPSAMNAEDVPVALHRLRVAIDGDSASEPIGDSADNGEEPDDLVSLRQRALPLIELLEAAVKEDKNVMWEN